MRTQQVSVSTKSFNEAWMPALGIFKTRNGSEQVLKYISLIGVDRFYWILPESIYYSFKRQQKPGNIEEYELLMVDH
jgi:hypothetical protein